MSAVATSSAATSAAGTSTTAMSAARTSVIVTYVLGTSAAATTGGATSVAFPLNSSRIRTCRINNWHISTCRVNGYRACGTMASTSAAAGGGSHPSTVPFREDTNYKGKHVVWTWVTPGQLIPGNARGARKLKCNLCGLEYTGNQNRAGVHFYKKRPSARCPHASLAIWRRLHNADAQFPPDILERVQRAMEENPNGDDDAHAVEDIAGSGGEGRCVGVEVEEAVGGHPLSGGDKCTRGEVTGGGTAVRTPATSKVEWWAGRTTAVGRQTSIGENAIPFNVTKSRSFKMFTLACYGLQPMANHPRVPRGYNPLRCQLLNRLRERLENEEQVIRDDWEVTGCTFITDGTTNICGRSLMNFILAGRSKTVFIKCEDMSEGDKDLAAIVASWKRFFREWGVDKITAICADSFAVNTSDARMLREDPEFEQIYRIPCTTHCMDLLMHDICKQEWADDIIKKANKVVNFFRLHRWPRSQLRMQLLQSPKLNCTCLLRPAQTRFGTHYVMLQRLEVCAKAITRIVNGVAWENTVWAFWTDVKKLAALMKGPYDVLRETDKDVHCLSRIYDMVCQLPVFVCAARLTEEERDIILTAVANRTDMLLNPIHAMAQLLDPVLRDIVVFSNVELMPQFESVVDRLIGKRGSKKFTDRMDQLYDFQFGNGVFGSERAVQRASKDNAVLWWEAHGAGHPKIEALTIKVLSIWTTSSPAERNWSTWALVQTKSRKKLHHQRTEKLVYSHWSLRLKNQGGDGPAVAGGWLGLVVDWADEDLEGDHAGMTDAVDDGEVAHDGTRSAAGSTSVRRDPFMPGTSTSAERLGEVGEGVGTEEVDVDEEEEDFDDEDDIPGEEWEDERSDSDRSWTRREEKMPYIPGTRSGLRSQSRRQEEEPRRHHDEDRADDEQRGGDEEEEEEHQGGDEEEVEEQRGGDEHEEAQGEAGQQVHEGHKPEARADDTRRDEQLHTPLEGHADGEQEGQAEAADAAAASTSAVVMSAATTSAAVTSTDATLASATSAAGTSAADVASADVAADDVAAADVAAADVAAADMAAADVAAADVAATHA
ncbi:hypothetical protein CBR_g49929 [Chara braunii]|uniref:DUF659 domain-containing protein n=1 Tax=Chara braunii TaxID=69332 RepID=A0A388JPF3_CHABU|nr:hypothetical protein CBR_g49929 [Chara braunii]|eukprot:GBG59665.1 hypothetical protein CBR_g49929 [Chara braunii]